MTLIATETNDSPARLSEMAAAQRGRPGFAIDAYFYRSQVVYRTELDEILYRSWLYAGHVSQVANPGDYFTYELGEDSMVVVRDGKGEIHALMNVCRHRGARVCEGPEGTLKTLVCPYHGWVYELDGRLKAARAMQVKADFDPGRYALKRAKCTVYEGLIFVNCDPDAGPFDTSLDSIAPALRPYGLPDARVAHRQNYPVEANWKLVLENYLECYHCATAHRAYARLHTLEALGAEVEALNARMLSRAEAETGVAGIAHDHYQAYGSSPDFGCCACTSRYALYDGFKTGSRGGEPVAPLMGEFKGYDGGAGDFQLGPLAFMLNYPDHCVLYRFTPRGIDNTDMDLVWFVRGDAEEGRDYDRDAVTWLWDRTSREDQYIITRNSEGVHSRFFEPGPYHPEHESMCIEFVDWYLSALERNKASRS
ncbi:MAG: aromatic ring-hydroxylating dioxygenase subunit alpha [Gammaproteobacteria bacterium]|nr:aromatic ring-hydroxylating dioxygenase subunit alpha [Gammaproteobacteria bacterium]